MISSPTQPPVYRWLIVFFALLSLVAVLWTPFFQAAPSRIELATDWSLLSVSPLAFIASTSIWGVAALMFCFLSPKWLRLLAVSAACFIFIPLLTVAASGAHLAWNLLKENPISRVGFGSGFWITLFTTFILYKLLPISRLVKKLVLWIFLAIIFIAGIAGAWNALSLVQEAQAISDDLFQELFQHILLSGQALIGGALLGLPVGILAHYNTHWRITGFITLNFFQTIPSLALFGLLILPLSWLATQFPLLQSWGIHGIGTTPALIALSLYAALPIARNTLTALDEIPLSIQESATGMGMTSWQRSQHILLPLTLPTIITGIRVAAVQTMGNTTVAALIGAGGLGVFIFQGLSQLAMDLVLIGTLIVVALAWIVDRLLRIPFLLFGGKR